VPEGPNRRTRLANEVVAMGLVKPMPVADAGESSGGPASGGPASGGPASGGPASGGPASGVPEQPVRRRREQAP
jgi:hypothetical protein